MTRGIANTTLVFIAGLCMVACSEQAPVDRHANDAPEQPPQANQASIQPTPIEPAAEKPAPVVVTALPDSVEGTVRGQPFTADQAKIENGILTLRQGKEFFADRSITIFTFRDKLDNQAFKVGGDSAFGRPHIHLGIRKRGKDLPDQSVVMDGYTMDLEFGQPMALGLPFTIRLHVEQNGEPTHVTGRYIATFGDLRIKGEAIDTGYDSFDTLEYVAKQYLATQYPGAGWKNRFGVSYTSNGDAPYPKRGFVGFERDAGDTAPSVVKIQLYKDASGWAFANELAPVQLNAAHPVGEWPDDHERSTHKLRVRTTAAAQLEQELNAEGVMARVRGTLETCHLAKGYAKGSCRITYGLKNGDDKACLARSYLLERTGDDWQVVRSISDDQKVDHAGQLKTYKPFSTNCS